MSESKYTPGPWETTQTLRGVKSFKTMVSAFPGEGSPIPICTASPSDTGEANARLIAAAPELLEALKELIRNTRPIRPLSQHWAAAEAAIAKAVKP